MWMIFLVIVFGLLSSSSSDNPTVTSRSCSYMGVFHVEGRARYNLTYKDAERLCEHLNASIAPMDQLERAYNAGLQTCRYGWVKDTQLVILRHKPHEICAGNKIGIVIWENTQHADTFCYDENDSSLKDCSARSGIYLPGSESLDPSDDDFVSAGNKTYVEMKDHENSTEDTHQEDTAASESSTPVYWTINVSASVNTSQSFTKNNETDETHETKHPQSTPVKPDTDAGLDGPQSPNKNNSVATGQDVHKSPIKDSPDATGQDVHQSPIKNSSDATGQDVHQSPLKNISDLIVILIAILAVLLILLICALVATRKRWCGKKRTLIITEKSSSDRKDTTASFTQQQEMTTLMNNEKNLSK